MKHMRKENIIVLALLYITCFILAYFSIYYLAIGLFIIFIYHIVIAEQERRRIILDYERRKQRHNQDMHKTEKKLYEKEQELDQLVNSLSVGIIMTDALGNILYANKSIIKNLDLEECTNIKAMVDSKVKKMIILSHISRKPNEQEIEHKNRYYVISLKPINSKDIFAGVIILMYDITSVKNLSNKQKDFIANVSHELKTPLASIKGVAELLQRDSKSDQELLDILSGETVRMEKVVVELLSYSKIDAMNENIELTQVNLEELLNSILSSKRDIKDNAIVRLDLKATTIKANVDLLELALRNLIRNANTYTKDHVFITSYYEQNSIIIKVTDNGIGIREEHLPKIFDRFYRVDESRNRNNGGTGLGLSIVKTIVSKHNWQITADSKFGLGTTFTITIPNVEV